jgi:hypothetical protein
MLRGLMDKAVRLFLSFLLIILIGAAQSYAESSQKPESDAYKIPALPAAGTVAGKPFRVEDARIDGTILELRQGSDFFPDRSLTIYLEDIQKGIVPAGRTFTYTGPDRLGAPRGSVQWRDEGDRIPKHHWIEGSYTVHVEFGKEEKRGWLPGRIYIRYDGEPGAQVAGEFNSVIKGLRMVNGVPDITSDSFDTLEYVALGYLERRFPDAKVKIEDTEDVMFGFRPKDPHRKDFTFFDGGQDKYGRMALRYSVDGEGRGWTKLKFRKEAGGWAVDYQLQPYKLFAARGVPDSDDDMGTIQYLVARQIEAEIVSAGKTELVHGVSMMPSYGRYFGEVGVRYSLGEDGQKIKRRFLLVPSDDSWKVERELEPDEIVDNVTGEIRTKK